MSKERNRLKMERQEGQEKEEWKAVDRKNKKKKKNRGENQKRRKGTSRGMRKTACNQRNEES